MQRKAGLFLLLGVSAAAAVAAQDAGPRQPGFAQFRPAAPSSTVAASIAQWNSLRQSDSLPFSS